MPTRRGRARHAARGRPGLKLAALLAAVVLIVLAALVRLHSHHTGKPQASGPSLHRTHPVGSSPVATAAPSPSASASPTPTTPLSPPPPPGPPSQTLRLHLLKVITGPISPKSVDASGTGLFFAQNMMYRHTVTVYNRHFDLVKTIPDSVDLAKMGYPQFAGLYRGAPVEAAFTPNRRYVYVSNYSMYGPDFTREGHDTCSPAAHYDRSFLYRINVHTLRIDQAIEVGSVPKYVAVTPNDRYVLASNWCSYDESIVSVAKHKEIKRIPLGPYPRGIAVNPSSTTAYVAVMGTTEIAKIDLRTFHVSWIPGVGVGPRHLVMSANGRWLYATLNSEGAVAKINLRTDRVVAKVSVGPEPRSMAIAPDGGSLYVVVYDGGYVVKIGTAHMAILQRVSTNPVPIGITYDPPTREVWVSCYGGSIMVFKDA